MHYRLVKRSAVGIPKFKIGAMVMFRIIFVAYLIQKKPRRDKSLAFNHLYIIVTDIMELPDF